MTTQQSIAITVPTRPEITIQAGYQGGAASSLTVKDEGSTVDATVGSINFVGSGVTATQSSSGHVTVTVSGGGGGGGSALTVKEEGTSVDTAVAALNFVGGSTTATQTSSGNVTVTSTAYYSGGTDVPVADGGTGASTAAGARTNLGLVIGTDVEAAGTAAGLISDTVYGSGWNGDTTHAPSKNAVYDKIETLSAGGGLTAAQAIAYAIALG